MRPGTLLLVPILAALPLASGCSGVPLLHNSGEDVAPPEAGMPDKPPPAAAPVAAPDPALRDALAGKWRMEPKDKDALVPNLVLDLHPDGGLTLHRDDSGGTNFSVQLSGTWAAGPLGPDRVQVALNVAAIRPARRCYALPGTCQPYTVPFTERYAFARTGPETMETPGAVWRREPAAAAGSGGPTPGREPGSAEPAGAEPTPPGGQFALHLVSRRSPAAAAAAWRRLAKRYPELAGLEPGEPRAVRVPGRGTRYTVDAGAFATAAEAEAACARLRSRGQSCEVTAR